MGLYAKWERRKKGKGSKCHIDILHQEKGGAEIMDKTVWKPEVAGHPISHARYSMHYCDQDLSPKTISSSAQITIKPRET